MVLPLMKLLASESVAKRHLQLAMGMADLAMHKSEYRMPLTPVAIVHTREVTSFACL